MVYLSCYQRLYAWPLSDAYLAVSFIEYPRNSADELYIGPRCIFRHITCWWEYSSRQTMQIPIIFPYDGDTRLILKPCTSPRSDTKNVDQSVFRSKRLLSSQELLCRRFRQPFALGHWDSRFPVFLMLISHHIDKTHFPIVLFWFTKRVLLSTFILWVSYVVFFLLAFEVKYKTCTNYCKFVITVYLLCTVTPL